MYDDEGVEEEGQDSSGDEVIVLEDDRVVIPDGVYEFFSFANGAATVYELDRQTALVAIEDAKLIEGDYGTVVSQGGELTSLEVVGNSRADEATQAAEAPGQDGSESYESEGQQGEADGYAAGVPVEEDRWAAYRAWPDAIQSKLLEAENVTSGLALKELVAAQDESRTMPFLATSNYAVFGTADQEIAEYFAPVAVQGQIRFTRNRTRPNVFSVENITPAYPDPDFPTIFTGTGDDRALAKLQAQLKYLVQTGNFYPYRDAERIRIEGV